MVKLMVWYALIRWSLVYESLHFLFGFGIWKIDWSRFERECVDGALMMTIKIEIKDARREKLKDFHFCLFNVSKHTIWRYREEKKHVEC